MWWLEGLRSGMRRLEILLLVYTLLCSLGGTKYVARRSASHRTWLRARIDHSIDKRQERSDALRLAQRSKTNEPSSLMGERVRADQRKQFNVTDVDKELG